MEKSHNDSQASISTEENTIKVASKNNLLICITNNNNNFKSGTTIPSTNLKNFTRNYSSESNSSS